MNEFKAPVPLEFPVEMLRQITLSTDPDSVAASYGFDYETIKDLIHFKTKLAQVENAMMLDGELTTVLAGAGLHAAVEKLAFRVQDDRIGTGDLIKSIEVFKKIKDGNKPQEAGTAGQSVSLIINIPAIGSEPAKVIEVTQNQVIDVEAETIEEPEEQSSAPAESFSINI